jgi:hypothetical protein
MNGNLNAKSPLLWIGLIAFVAIAVLCTMNIWHLVSGSNGNQAMILTSVMMVGLALVTALMIVLLIFFKATGNDDKSQALALPSGSIRALLAFALVLMFVTLGVHLYEGVANNGAAVTKTGLTQPQVDALKAQFSLVFPSPAAGQPAGSSNLFDVTYYPGRSKEADDLAKQMFTQLATVFVTVIGFYFGSSTASAGVNTGVAAAGSVSGKSPSPSSTVPASLQEAKAMAHDADLNLERIRTVLSQISGESPDKITVQNLFEDTQKMVNAIHEKVKTAMDAAAKFGTASDDAENDAAAADVISARDQIKPLAATVKAAADQAALKTPAAPKP